VAEDQVCRVLATTTIALPVLMFHARACSLAHAVFSYVLPGARLLTLFVDLSDTYMDTTPRDGTAWHMYL
jgi:hypothetical protein